MRFFVDEDCEVPVAGGLKAVPLLRLDELTHVNGTKLALKQSKKNPVDPVQELLEVLHKAQPNPRLRKHVSFACFFRGAEKNL